VFGFTFQQLLGNQGSFVPAPGGTSDGLPLAPFLKRPFDLGLSVIYCAYRRIEQYEKGKKCELGLVLRK
jgi:hypothetical protein